MSQQINDIYEDELCRGVFETLETWEKRFGIELQSLFDPDHYSLQDAYRLFRERIVIGLSQYEGFPTEEADGESKDIEGQPKRMLSLVEYEPNYFISRYNAKIITNYKGDDVYNYVISVRKSLEIMAASENIDQLVASSFGFGIVAVGVQLMIQAAIIKKAEQLAWKKALQEGLKRFGLRTAVGAIVIALGALLLWAIFGKEARILGVLINDTDTNYIVADWRDGLEGYKKGNLYMAHGSTQSFPVTNLTEDIDSPELQLNARLIGEDDKDTMVAASMFFAKRKAGFRGAEGVYIFTDYAKTDPGFAFQFAVPYTNDNGVNIGTYPGGVITNKGEIDKIFRTLYNSRKVDFKASYNNRDYSAQMNSARGGACCSITSVSAPLKYPT
ncbi:hypothetical protein [Pseudanabaena sp. PCC 6802]|uniref:hypothetical protein n=1 Tax=Pseudanabaena sp. PCC 6802 TaxID=118173 RepID=UPI0012EA751A|nr:hypothetical protein [Pseudanabaena sp. PCC 6802]